MKYDKPRKCKAVPPLREQRVRVPGDYPWQVLNTLIECGSQLNAVKDRDVLLRITRQRDYNAYLDYSAVNGLQSISATDCLSPHNVEWQMLLSQVIKKYQFDGSREERKLAAIATVLEGDNACSAFNRHLWKRIDLQDPANIYAREFISRVLGDSLPESSKLLDRSRHGPGASTGASYGQTSSYFKYSDYPYHVTARCETHAKTMILDDKRWLDALASDFAVKFPDLGPLVEGSYAASCFWDMVLERRESNKITTVQKDARTDRPIAVEPDLNVMLQLGVDGFVRKRLKRWGIDLDSQVKNQALAQTGSLDPSALSPATIDLKSASDSISLRACKLLLPEPWFRYLCDIRSPKGILPSGKVLRFSKISTMGNGSTFAIESLIFASIVYGVSKAYGGGFDRERTAIYGDDIIVPRYLAPDVIYYLAMWGFSTNKTKTFIQGPVRESCGADWYRGRLIRPVFLKKKPETVSDLLCDRNRITRWLRQRDLDVVVPVVDELYMKWIPQQFLLPFRLRNRELILQGPLSDEEFDTYWHTVEPPCEKSRGQFYLVGKLTVKFGNRDEEATAFKFRKLMSSLHPKPPVDPYSRPKCNSGSAFSVIDQKSIRRGVTGVRVFNWTRAYSSLYVTPAKADATTN